MSLSVVSLRSLLDEYSEEDVLKDILFLFESKDCKGTHSSKDIESFLHNKNKAINFAVARLSEIIHRHNRYQLAKRLKLKQKKENLCCYLKKKMEKFIFY